MIEYSLFSTISNKGRQKKINIDLFPSALDLYEQLDELDIIQRLMSINQLGIIKVKQNIKKSDYVFLQLYFHQLIKEDLKTNEKLKLKFSYNNRLGENEFDENLVDPSSGEKPTLADVLQILTICYSIGHLYTTFTGSKAILLLAKESETFFRKLMGSCESLSCKDMVSDIIQKELYHRIHLINSMLVLEKCDQEKFSVILAIKILELYYQQHELSEENNLRYAFDVFKKVRDLSFVICDLIATDALFTFDINKKEGILRLFREALSEHNDQQPIMDFIKSIRKILDDTVYYEKFAAIHHHRISKQMARLIQKQMDSVDLDYYDDLWLKKDSILNDRRNIYPPKDFSDRSILKLTFSSEERNECNKLFGILDRRNHVRVGYYDRHSGERTILVSISNQCKNKARVALMVLNDSIRTLRLISTKNRTDVRYLLGVKFFLYYLFNEHPIEIKATIDEEICAICTKGRDARKNEIIKLLKKSRVEGHHKSEVKFLLSRLKEDKRNDLTITVPGSILLFEQEKVNLTKGEFDGIIVYPTRKEKQVLFLESKQTANKPSQASKELSKALKKFGVHHNEKDIEIENHNAYYYHTI